MLRPFPERSCILRSAIIWILAVACSNVARAQKNVGLEFGVRAGIPFTVPLESDLTGAGSIFSSFAFERSKFSVGPAITAVVMDRVAIEFDAIYKPIRFKSSFSSGFVLPMSTIRGASWEFPLFGFGPSAPGFTVQESFEKPGYTAGPALGAVLYDRLLIQFDALYKPIRSVRHETTPVANLIYTSRAGSWEFPIVFDYLFLHRAVRPFAGGGMVAGQTVSGTTALQGVFLTNGQPIHSNFQYFASTNQLPAYVTSAGVEWNRSHVVIRPEFRYTHWHHTNGSPSRKRNQFEFLIGFLVRPGG